MMIAEVIIFNGPPKPLSYSVPREMENIVSEGQRVIVPLGRRKTFGIIYALLDGNESGFKPLIEKIDKTPVIDRSRLTLLKWLCRYYYASPRDSMGLFIPKALTNPDLLTLYALINKDGLTGVKNLPAEVRSLLEYIVSHKKVKLSTARTGFKGRDFYLHLEKLENMGLIKIGYRPPKRKDRSLTEDINDEPDTQSIIFNPEQEAACGEVSEALRKEKFQPFLLFGVTGSGKTELYLRLIWETLQSGKTALLLLPEIAASEEIYSKIKRKLGDNICRIHSALKPSQRLVIWDQIRNGKYKVVIGPRSSLFAPIPRPGLIIVDEEHDSSYKQSGSSPHYHGRDVALMLGKTVSCPVVLGSATPSLESWHNCRIGKYKLLRLTTRWDSRALPAIKTVEYAFQPAGSSISEELLLKMNEVLKENGQVMLLLNRRGFAPTVKCSDCGFSLQCPNCSVGLVYHRSANSLKCHFCDYQTCTVDICPRCSGHAFQYYGAGTQKLEDEISVAFPKINSIRLDLDSTALSGNLSKTLDDFRSGRIKILMGTQMIAKSFDFPHVALMGILSADAYLEFPDFRSREKTYALLLQASGRAGRGKFPGEVIIQHSPVYKDFIENVSEDNVEKFLNSELLSRKELDFPPFKHLILIHLKSPGRAKGESSAGKLAEIFDRYERNYKSVFSLMGPAESPLFKVRNNFRWQFMIKTSKVLKTLEILDYIISLPHTSKILSGIRLTVDVDPIDML